MPYNYQVKHPEAVKESAPVRLQKVMIPQPTAVSTLPECTTPIAIDSREAAAMVEKRHDHLMRDIRGYIDALAAVSAPMIKCKKTPIKKCRKVAKGGGDMIASNPEGNWERMHNGRRKMDGHQNGSPERTQLHGDRQKASH
jgi:hypothetical protein